MRPKSEENPHYVSNLIIKEEKMGESHDSNPLLDKLLRKSEE